MTYVRVDKLEDGSYAIDTSEGMTKSEAVEILDIGKNEAAFSPPDIWPGEDLTEEDEPPAAGSDA